MKRRIVLFAALAIVLATGSMLLAQSSPFAGTWKLNVASSKFDPGPAPQSQMRTLDAAGMLLVNGINAAGKATSYGYTFKADGKGYPTLGAIPNTGDTIMTKKIDANTYEANFTKAGKHVETATFMLSNGGKTMTVHAEGATDKGAFTNNTVWEKQ